VEEIALARQLKQRTVYGHLEDALLAGETIDLERLVEARAREEIGAALARSGFGNLTGAFEALNGRYTYEQIRLCRAAAQSPQADATP
jgi:ATP-dependent DNA helicase RecQ